MTTLEQEPITNFRRDPAELAADLDYEARRDAIEYANASKRPAATRRKYRHTIGDIHYEPGNGPSWLVCALDDDRLDAESPEALHKLWTAHGGKAS